MKTQTGLFYFSQLTVLFWEDLKFSYVSVTNGNYQCH